MLNPVSMEDNKACFWEKKGNCIPKTTSAELAWTADGWASEKSTQPFLFNSPLTVTLSVKAAPLAPHPWAWSHVPLPVSHGGGGGSTGQACCFSPSRQWLPGFLLCWSIAVKCCKPQHITYYILPCPALNFTCVGRIHSQFC